MKVYYICECCDEVFQITDAEGPEGAVSIQGICESCALEMGMVDNHHDIRTQTYYS